MSAASEGESQIDITGEMGSASELTHPASEREILYRATMANYRPPVTLRTNHKRLLKLAWSIRQGYDGTQLSCLFCHKLLDFDQITIHHRDGNEEHNHAENLAPACYACNYDEGWKVRLRKKAEVGESVRELAAPAFAESSQKEWSSEEGRRSDKMTYRYRQRLFHPQTGMMRNAGQQFGKKALALLLPDELGIGKSPTYTRYIEEDVAAGYFDVKTVDGEDKIERTMKAYPLSKLGMKAESKIAVATVPEKAVPN